MFVSIWFHAFISRYLFFDFFFAGESKPSCDVESHQSSHHEHGLSKPQEISSPSDVCCNNISVKVYKSFMKMMNLGLLKDPIFVLFTVSDFATSLGYYVPYFIICDQAIELGIAKEEASHLLSIIGILNTLSRIIWGYVSDKSWVNRLYVYNICLAICGIGNVCFCIYFCRISFKSDLISIQQQQLHRFFAMTSKRWQFMRQFLDSQLVVMWHCDQ